MGWGDTLTCRKNVKSRDIIKNSYSLFQVSDYNLNYFNKMYFYFKMSYFVISISFVLKTTHLMHALSPFPSPFSKISSVCSVPSKMASRRLFAIARGICGQHPVKRASFNHLRSLCSG